MADEIIEDVMMRNTKLAVDLDAALKLLAVAAMRHPEERWAKTAHEQFPDLNSKVPCLGEFGPVPCCEFHAHTLKCGDPDDICAKCGETNEAHRELWKRLK
jgi:hypothetical protein